MYDESKPDEIAMYFFAISDLQGISTPSNPVQSYNA
jgi:hypothetical protein